MVNSRIMQIKEVMRILGKDGIFENQLACHEADEKDPDENIIEHAYLDAFSFTLVLNGTAETTINYHRHTIGKGDLVFLLPLSVISYHNLSNDFAYIDLIVSRTFLNKLPVLNKIFTHAYFSIKFFREPIANISTASSLQLHKQMKHIRERIFQTNHSMHKEVIKNAVVGFMLDLDDILATDFNSSDELSRQEVTLKKFLDMLSENYKSAHNVSFYARSLSITPQYLSIIVKKYTGLTVSDLIFDMLFSESRILLQEHNLSVQQIADILHFSDQSSFGKFFKRKASMSPLEFRRVSQI